MTNSRQRNFSENLADFLASTEGMTDKELDEALKAEGVDISGLVADVKAIVAKGERRRKEAWAHRMVAHGDSIVARLNTKSSYEKLERSHLIAEVSKRAQTGAQAFFHGYKEASDGDLRAMLAEFDAVNGVPQKDK